MPVTVLNYADSATVVTPPDQWILNGQLDESPYINAYNVWVAVETINLVTGLRTTYELEHDGATGEHLDITALSAHVTGALSVGGGYGSTGLTAYSNGDLSMNGILTVGGSASVASLLASGNVQAATLIRPLTALACVVHLAGRGHDHYVLQAGGIVGVAEGGGAFYRRITTNNGLTGAGGEGIVYMGFDGPEVRTGLSVGTSGVTVHGVVATYVQYELILCAMNATTGVPEKTWTSGVLTTNPAGGDVTLTTGTAWTPSSTHRGHTFLMKVEFASEHATNNGSFTLRALEIPYTVTRITRG